MKISIFTLIGILLALYLSAQRTDTLLLKVNGIKINSVLTVPKTENQVPLAIFIAGSGPTDLDGNNLAMKNNSLRYLSDALVTSNIATLSSTNTELPEVLIPALMNRN